MKTRDYIETIKLANLLDFFPIRLKHTDFFLPDRTLIISAEFQSMAAHQW